MAFINLWNRNWHNGVNVDARVGNYQDCNQNNSIGSRSISYNSSWSIDAGTQDVCYRRDNDPDHPDGSWTGWTRISNFGHDKDENI